MKSNLSNIDKAIGLLEESSYTCVLCKEDMIYTSIERGVKPLLEWYNSGTNVEGFSAADKVVGNAVAFLYVLLGVDEVFAPVMSEAAKHTLTSNGIKVQRKLLVPQIINRAGTGRCPMEEAVDGILDPEEALVAIKLKLKSLVSNYT